MYDPDIELYVPGSSGFEAGVMRGAEAVERWYGHSFAQWKSVRYEMSEVKEWGPHVAAFVRWVGEGKRSEVPVESHVLIVFSFEDDRIVSIAQLGGVTGDGVVTPRQ